MDNNLQTLISQYMQIYKCFVIENKGNEELALKMTNGLIGEVLRTSAEMNERAKPIKKAEPPLNTDGKSIDEIMNELMKRGKK